MTSVKQYFPLLSDTVPQIMHEMGWWSKTKPGGHKHPQVDYESDDPVATDIRMERLADLGFDAICLDYYGDSPKFRLINRAAGVMAASCLKNNLRFTVGIDIGAIKNKPDPTISDTQEFINILSYVLAYGLCTFEINGTKTILEFGMETLSAPLDWVAITKAFPNVRILHRNIGGFSVPNSDGAYAWIDSGEAYLKDFYTRALTPSKNQICVGSVFKGFDNRKVDPITGVPLSPPVPCWGNLQQIPENQGQTLLNTIAITNDFISKGGRLAAIQWNTDNDWEEGTALEKKVDSGVITSISGNKNCIDATMLTFKPMFH